MTARTVKMQAPVTIIGKGTVKSTGAPVYAATSTSEPGKLHLITWSQGAQQWECGCPAFVWRKRCSHIRALSDRLAVELRRRDAAVQAAQIAEDDTFAITPAGRAALAAYEAAKRETASRRVQSFPVSLLK